MTTITLDSALDCWWHRQGLASANSKNPADIIKNAGWMNTAGSSAPYLAIAARAAASTRGRDALENEIYEKNTLVEVPSARGCTMLVAREDAALAIAAGMDFHADRKSKLFKTTDITDRELDALCDKITKTLARGPLDIAAIKAAIGAGAARPFGEAGRKLGESSTLTFALKELQFRGLAARVGASRRLDTDQFVYTLAPWKARELEPYNSESYKSDADALEKALAARFFAWAAPATAAEFANWAGIGIRRAAEIAEKLRLEARSIDGLKGVYYCDAAAIEYLQKKRSADRGRVALLPFRDNYVYFRRPLAPLIPPDAGRSAFEGWSGDKRPLETIESLHFHAIVVDGRLAGAFEYDGARRAVVHGLFVKPDAALRDAVDSAIAGVEAFIREKIEDLWFYSMDNTKNRAQRIAAILQLKY
ncbi:MAG: winged helix DNA-binding domain-containing protein [Planctomycetes bacterium]|nr:winged helix DNA-binding domain-containing protein [Planctomycetota bacterium]